MDWARELRERIASERGTGVVRLEAVSVFELPLSDGSRSVRDIADALARHVGLRAIGRAWRHLSRDEARAAIVAPLLRDLAYSAECMPSASAQAFADEFLERLGPEAEFVTNGTFPPFEANAVGWRGSWTPLTAATFDVGIVGVSREWAALLCVEDED